MPKGKSAKLEAVLTVPAGLGNEYAYRVGEVDWVFTVEGFNNEKPLIPTGQLNWPVAVFGALGVLLIAGGVVVLTKKKKHDEASKKIGIVLLTAGAVLVIAALLLFFP